MKVAFWENSKQCVIFTVFLQNACGTVEIVTVIE